MFDPVRLEPGRGFIVPPSLRGPRYAAAEVRTDAEAAPAGQAGGLRRVPSPPASLPRACTEGLGGRRRPFLHDDEGRDPAEGFVRDEAEARLPRQCLVVPSEEDRHDGPQEPRLRSAHDDAPAILRGPGESPKGPGGG